MLKREIWHAERFYVHDILQNSLESRNNKTLWKYVKSQNTKHLISAFESNGNEITDSSSKAEIFTFNLNLFSLPKIKPVHIAENCVFMVDRIDVSK